MPFILDPRLEAESQLIAEWPLSQLRLVDDARFAWLLLVPRVPGCIEWVDLDVPSQRILLAEINQAAALLRTCAPCDKLNIGALGNIVRQLHIHIVARTEGDVAWPGPVWGSGVRQALPQQALITRLRTFRSRSESCEF